MELRHRSLDREHGTGDLRCFCRNSYLDGNSNLLIRATKDIVQGQVAYQSARLTRTFPGCHAPVTPGLFSVGWYPTSSSCRKFAPSPPSGQGSSGAGQLGRESWQARAVEGPCGRHSCPAPSGRSVQNDPSGRVSGQLSRIASPPRTGTRAFSLNSSITQRDAASRHGPIPAVVGLESPSNKVHVDAMNEWPGPG